MTTTTTTTAAMAAMVGSWTMGVGRGGGSGGRWDGARAMGRRAGARARASARGTATTTTKSTASREKEKETVVRTMTSKVKARCARRLACVTRAVREASGSGSESDSTLAESGARAAEVGDDEEAVAEVSSRTPFTVYLDNPGDGQNTSIRVLGPNKRGELAKIVSALTHYGLDVQSSFTRSTSGGRTIDDVFYVTVDADSGSGSFDDTVNDGSGKVPTQVPESQFEDLRQFILQALTPSHPSALMYTSRQPKIYGVAAEAEVLALKRRGVVNKRLAAAAGGTLSSSSSSSVTSADPLFMASQLEIVAAELASATAKLVQIERVYADVETCGIDGLWDTDERNEYEQSQDPCTAIEAERADARAMFERKLAAIEAALAARDRARKDITSVIEKAPMSTISKSQQPVDERNTLAKPKPMAGRIEPMAPQTPLMSPLSRPLPSTPCGNGKEIILQGFNWESCNEKVTKGRTWYEVLTSQAPDIAKAGFTSIWMPPPTKSVSKQGYLPTDLYDLNSFYGTEDELRSCIARMREYNITPVADIVINHRCAEAQDDAGRWNQYTGKIAWDARAVTCENPDFGGKGARGTGEDYLPAPNIDHTQDFVREDLKTWLKWLREDVGFRGWRFDFVKGYSGTFTGEYVEETRPFLSFGEFWDACDYRDGVLEYNQDRHRQRTCDWVDSTGGNTAAFDFTTKGILQEALGRTEYWRLIDSKGKPPGFCGMWPSRAVTFIENHDTGSTLQHWPFPSSKILQGYCYILTHPGTPTVFYDHWQDEKYAEGINAMLQVRKRAGITSRAAVHIEQATAGCYAAHLGRSIEEDESGSSSDVDISKPSICMKIGKEDWSPNAGKVANKSWKCTASGDGWAIWEDRDFLESVSSQSR
jgi:alpha-amylase